MSTSDKIAIVAAVTGGLGLVVAIIAAVYAGVSASASKKAAVAAEKAADEAAALRQIEADRRVEEKEQRHVEMGPPSPGQIPVTFKPNPMLPGHGALFATIKVPHTYRAQAVAILDNGAHVSTGLTSVLHPNQEYEFEVEKRHADEEDHADQNPPETLELWFRFWPPLEPDGVGVWSCPCGRPTGESLDGPGHWEWRIPVRYEAPTKPATARAQPPKPGSRPFQ